MRNWLILFSYSGASFINGLAWVTLIPIPDLAKAYYNIGDLELTLYSYVAFIISLVMAPISAYIISKSFYLTLHLIWLVSLIGTLIRYLAFSDFWLSLAGQTVVESGNMLMLGSCSTLAVTWFPQNQQVLATSIAASMNFIGMGFGFAYIPYIQSISNLMLLQLIISGLFWIFNLGVLVKDQKIDSTLGFSKSLEKAFSDKSLIFLIFCSGSGLGVNYSIISIFGLLLSNENYSVYESGWIGFTYLVSGLFGGLIATYFTEVKKSTRSPLLFFLISCIVISVAFSIFVGFQFYVFIFSGLYGGLLTGILPLCIRICTNFFPEIHESIPTNIIYLVALVFSCIYTYPIQYCKDFITVSGFWAASLLIFFSFFGFFLYLLKVSEKNFENCLNGKIVKDSENEEIKFK